MPAAELGEPNAGAAGLTCAPKAEAPPAIEIKWNETKNKQIGKGVGGGGVNYVE